MNYEENLVDQFEITEIDLEYYYSTELDENDDPIRIEIIPSNDVYYAECPPAKIDEVIEGLLELKKKGAERVYISEHTDHHGYHFYGIKLVECKQKMVKAWRCIKAFPGVNYGETYIFDDRCGKYIDYPAKRGHTEFSLFEHYPEYFEKIEVEI